MKDNFVKGVLSIFLFIVLFALSVGGLGVLWRELFDFLNNMSIKKFGELILLTIYTANYIIVVLNLTFIVNSTSYTPFISGNVKRFKIMGTCLLVNSVSECIIGFYSNSDAPLVLFGIRDAKNMIGGLTGSMVFNIIFALMCFVLAEVIDKAIKIKNENDLTI